jgi:hypothetical protein
MGPSEEPQRVLCKEEVLAEIKSLHQQLAERTNELPDKPAFPQPYLNIEAENALVDRILELFNATGLTAHQAKKLLGRVMNLIELSESCREAELRMCCPPIT